MSLDPCRPLSSLSLSLTSLLSRPVSIQGSIVGSSDPHSHLRVGRGFIGGGLSRREGSLSLIHSSGVLQQGPCCARHGASSLVVARGFRTCSFARRLPGFRRDQHGPLRRLQTPAPKPADSRRGATDRRFICGTMHLVPLIPARLRKTSGALIVTVLVTIQGSARALSTPGPQADRGPTAGRKRNESSGSQAESLGVSLQLFLWWLMG